jgi:hypothetical protein
MALFISGRSMDIVVSLEGIELEGNMEWRHSSLEAWESKRNCILERVTAAYQSLLEIISKQAPLRHWHVTSLLPRQSPMVSSLIAGVLKLRFPSPPFSFQDFALFVDLVRTLRLHPHAIELPFLHPPDAVKPSTVQRPSKSFNYLRT